MMTDINSIAQRAQEYLASGRYKDEIKGIDPNDPWAYKSLDAIESYFLANHQELSPEYKMMLQLFLGEGLRQRFGGRWASGLEFDSDDPSRLEVFGIMYPQGHMDVISSVLETALAFNTGNSWSLLFETTHQLIESDQQISETT